MIAPLRDRAIEFASKLIGNSDARPVAVLDIGSNSVRLVVYERFARALTPLFNEKASCALGRGVSETGVIADENAALAFTAFHRFARVVQHLNLSKLHIIATSAVREASNGQAFMQNVERIMGAKGRVLSGEEEAHFAALGIIAGMPDFVGYVGDLGGGSLELARIDKGADGVGETLGLGAIKLQDASDGDAEKAYDLACAELKNSQTFSTGKPNGSFAAVGGTWRALAKVLQNRSDYPLRMIQGYAVDAKTVSELCHEIVEGTLKSAHLQGVGSTRRSLLPFGAAAMAATIDMAEFDQVTFSALGVREGYLFGQLDEKQAVADPLIQAVQLFNHVRARSPQHADDLVAFSDRFFIGAKIAETASEKRLRHAACYLSDIGWRGHPDYRGEQSVDLVAYSAMAGVDHAGRAFLAEVLAVRYLGLRHDSTSLKLMTLVSSEGHERARLIGALIRVALYMSGAIDGILPHVALVAGDDEALILCVPQSKLLGQAEKIESRLKHVSSVLDRPLTLEVGPD